MPLTTVLLLLIMSSLCTIALVHSCNFSFEGLSSFITVIISVLWEVGGTGVGVLVNVFPVGVHHLCVSFIWQFGRTEQQKNDLNPKFTTAIEMKYCFEEVQELRFAIYDIDNTTSSLEDDDFLGSIECTLGEVGVVCCHGSIV